MPAAEAEQRNRGRSSVITAQRFAASLLAPLRIAPRSEFEQARSLIEAIQPPRLTVPSISPGGNCECYFAAPVALDHGGRDCQQPVNDCRRRCMRANRSRGVATTMSRARQHGSRSPQHGAGRARRFAPSPLLVLRPRMESGGCTSQWSAREPAASEGAASTRAAMTVVCDAVAGTTPLQSWFSLVSLNRLPHGRRAVGRAVMPCCGATGRWQPTARGSAVRAR
jgi:hypothetical protein